MGEPVVRCSFCGEEPLAAACPCCGERQTGSLEIDEASETLVGVLVARVGTKPLAALERTLVEAGGVLAGRTIDRCLVTFERLEAALRAARASVETDPQARVGVHHGHVGVGEGGGVRSSDHAPGVAARLERFATPGSVVVSGEVVGASRSGLELEQLGATRVRGLGSPVELHELRGIGTVAPAAEAGRSWVGRSAERGRIDALVRRAIAGRGGTLVLVGKPGVGKSALLDVALARDDVRVVRWVAPRGGGPLATAAVVARQALGLEPGAPHEHVLEALEPLGRLADADVVSQLLSVELWAVARRENPERFRREGPAAFARLVTAVAAGKPLVVGIDDAHAIDAASRPFLGALAREAAKAPVALVAMARPGGAPGWERPVELGHFGEVDLRRLLASTVGEGPDLDPVIDPLVARAAGSPTFAVEAVRDLVETEVLRGDPGRHRLAGEVRLPATASAVVAQRLDRRGQLERGMLRALAVVARPLRLGDLATAAGLDEAHARRLVEVAAADGFVRETADGWVLASETVREVVDADRAPLDDALLEALANAPGGDGTLADLRRRDGDLGGAVVAEARASARALALGAFREAHRRATAGLEDLGAVGDAERRHALETELVATARRALRATRGSGDPELRQLVARARRLREGTREGT